MSLLLYDALSSGAITPFRLITYSTRHPPPSPLFPYTTLFRSIHRDHPLVDQLLIHEQRLALGALRDVVKHLAVQRGDGGWRDRKSTRLNSSHRCISYAVFCLKKNIE